MTEMEPLRRQPLAPLRPFVLPRLHDDAALDGHVGAALKILERTGVRVLSERALAVFADHGASVDAATSVVRLPRGLVRGALASAPRTFVLGARDPAFDLDLASGDGHMTTDGCDVEVIDWRTGERRASTKADLADATRVQDYLGSIGFWWPTVAAGDCGATAQLHELEVAWNGTVKHVQGMVQGEREARFAVEMARVIAGGEDALRRRPPLSDLISVVSPLTIDRDGADAGLVFAEAGVPVAVVSWPARGTTAPATAAGATAQGLAEIAAMTALLQLAYPGAPVIGYLLVVSSDPRTGAIVTCPFADRDPTLVVDLVHRLGLPCLAAFAGTDDEATGTWRAAAESSHSLMAAAWSGAELTVGLGGTNGSILWSFTELLLDDHLYHQARYAAAAIPIDDERLALDVIDAVGPGGHFLGHAHTRRHLREEFARGLTLVAAETGGYRDAVEVARERAVEILERYVTVPLEAGKAAALRDLVAAADAELR